MFYLVTWFRPDNKSSGTFNKLRTLEDAEAIARRLNAQYPEYRHHVIDESGKPVVMPQMMPEVQELSEN